MYDVDCLGVILQSKKIELADGYVVNCLWISQDPEQLGEAAREMLNLTLTSSLNHSLYGPPSSASNQVTPQTSY